MFSNNRNRQTIHKRFYFIFIFNCCNDVNIIFRFDFLLFRFFYKIDRNINYFLGKFILDSDMFYFENIEQFLVFNFSDIKLSLHCFHFLFKLNEKILKLSHFRVDDVCAMIYNIINRNNYDANTTLLISFFAHINDTTNVFY